MPFCPRAVGAATTANLRGTPPRTDTSVKLSSYLKLSKSRIHHPVKDAAVRRLDGNSHGCDGRRNTRLAGSHEEQDRLEGSQPRSFVAPQLCLLVGRSFFVLGINPFALAQRRLPLNSISDDAVKFLQAIGDGIGKNRDGLGREKVGFGRPDRRGQVGGALDLVALAKR